MCQIDQRESTVSFAAICRVLRELFAKNHGGSIRPPHVLRSATPERASFQRTTFDRSLFSDYQFKRLTFSVIVKSANSITAIINLSEDQNQRNQIERIYGVQWGTNIERMQLQRNRTRRKSIICYFSEILALGIPAFCNF